MPRSAAVVRFTLVAVVVGAASFLGHGYWCASRLRLPIFEIGALSGNADSAMRTLGPPNSRSVVRSAALAPDPTLGRVFDMTRVVGLPDRDFELLLWKQECLGSVIWRFAILRDPVSGDIVLFGGEAKHHSPIYLGGGEPVPKPRSERPIVPAPPG